MKIPKELTTVTRISKALALLMFIVLPICGFFLGMQYQSSIDTTQHSLMPTPTNLQVSPTITP